MSNLVELADRLGKKIAETEEFKNLKQARQAVKDDSKAQQLNNELEQVSQKLAKKERENQPIEVSEKRELQTARDAIHNYKPLQDLAKAEADFAALMYQFNNAINKHLQT